jgi:chromate transport protein ChrA
MVVVAIVAAVARFTVDIGEEMRQFLDSFVAFMNVGVIFALVGVSATLEQAWVLWLSLIVGPVLGGAYVYASRSRGRRYRASRQP